MRPFRFINPVFIYQRKHLLGLYARNYTNDAKRFVQRHLHAVRVRLAEAGLGLTTDDRRMAALKNKHAGRRAFIIGNGPSLRIDDLERLSGEITFASNRIYVCFGETSWRPTYYITSYLDDLHENFYLDIDRFNGPVKFLPAVARKRCMPVTDAIYYRRKYHWFYPGKPDFSYNTLYTVCWGGTITYESIQLACYMGIREIYLVGVDFNYVAPESVKRDEKGWYAVERDVDHFHPDYLKPGEKAGVPLLHLQKAAYEKARDSMGRLGGHIFNATRGGKLEVYDRVELDRLLEK